MSVADEIEKLSRLKDSGALTDQEFKDAKVALLKSNPSASDTFKQTVDNLSRDTNIWGMFIHLSQLCGYVFPLAGFVVPIILWQIKKDESEVIDQHGRIVTNWIISACIYGLVAAMLSVILIGIPLLMALGLAAIIFPILGGVKANDGEVWRYPCSIEFFKVDTFFPSMGKTGN